MASRSQPGAGPDGALRLPDRYCLRRHLASGGMASVYCAEDSMLGRTVAIKVLAERFRHDEMAMRRFKREARAAARVSTHPHVVTIFDVGDLACDEADAQDGAPPRPFMVMEYLAGGTVADALRVGAVRRQEALRWIREAASALDHAHAAGIVHRDIKPANFLLDRSRVLHVADFGIARLVSEDTISRADELFGTAAYLAPEQALGRPATGASDLYSLAVAAFELLTGQRPFLAGHFAAQARQHVEDPPPSASERDRTLPPFVDDVLIRGMAKQPEERFATAAEFVDALDTAVSGGVPISSISHRPAPPRPPRPGRTSRRARAVAAQAGEATERIAVPIERPARHDPAPPPAIATAAAAAATASAATATAAAASTQWSSASLIERGARSPARGRALALAALVVAFAAVGAITLGAGGGHARPAARITAAHPAAAATTVAAARRPARRRIARHATAVTTAPMSTPVPATPAPPPAEAVQLQLTGHQEMLAGNYQVAIATLHKAVAAASPGSLTYAYGLYDLARSLVMSGNPGAAVPILQQRLKIPNQTGVVRQMLNKALRASGQVPAQMVADSGTTSTSGTGSSTSSSSSSSSSPAGSSTSPTSSSTSTASGPPAPGRAPATGPPAPARPHHHHPAPPSGGAGLTHGPIEHTHARPGAPALVD